MSVKQRLYYSVKTHVSTSLRFKYLIGVGVFVSLSLALVMHSRYEQNAQYPEINKVAVVKISPIESNDLADKLDMSTRKKIAEVKQLQRALNYDKSGTGLEQKQVLAGQEKLLRELEDVQLKIALHANDPAFDHHLWASKQQALEKKLTPSTH